ncbi:phage prohead protease, HK97 family [Klebsiella pneumoniae]|nr:phage prohead protease, HK97 family [Klebsiella pneumoniae]
MPCAGTVCQKSSGMNSGNSSRRERLKTAWHPVAMCGRCMSITIPKLLGRTKSGTLVLSEDDTGLRFELTPPNTQLGNDVLALVERGDLSGMSFGFRALKESWICAIPVPANSDRCELRGITVTSMPAYPESGVEIAHRSLFSQHPELRRAGDNRRRWAELAGL